MRKTRSISIILCIVLAFFVFNASNTYADTDEQSIGPEEAEEITIDDASGEITEDTGTEQLLNGQEAEEAIRTILIYMCGADLESVAALATANISQILHADFSMNDQVKVVIMTGGSEDWWLDEADCVIPEGVLINDFRDTDYNRIWEAKGSAAPENAGKLILLDSDGVLGTKESPSPAWEEPLSDPETLRAFINYGVEKYPAQKYDLVLWNHGGGPVDGFAYDEYSEDGSMMSLPEILDAISGNALTAEGGKFDFIDFDACLMNSVELNLALSDYTDYYIASAETEPGHGQDYQGWLSVLGAEPDCGTYQLGQRIVDDFIGFYTDEDGSETDTGTLAVVDTALLMEAGFAEAISGLSETLRAELNTPDENNEYLYYDELDSARKSIKYAKPDTYYKDLGNLVGQLAVANKEMSMKNLDETGNYSKLNAYADVSSKILSILNDPQIIYSRYTNNLVIGPEIRINAEKDLTYENLAPTGMHIYFPAVEDSDRILEYLSAVSGALPYIKNEEAKDALRSYAAFAAQQALMAELGYNVTFMIGTKGIPADEVDYDAVKKELTDGYVEGAPTLWDERIVPMIRYFADSEEAAVPWIQAVIRQQASDQILQQNISIHSDSEEGLFNVTIDNTGKRAVDNVKAKVIVELPAAQEFLENNLQFGYYLEYHPEQVECSIRTLNGIQDTSGMQVDYAADSIDTILEKYINWYREKTSVWQMEVPDNSVYAVQDAGGSLHAAQIEPLDDGRLMAYFRKTDPATGKPKYGYLVFEPVGNEYVLSKICENTQYGDRMIPAEDLLAEISDVTMSYSVSLNYMPFTLIPMSLTSFDITPENAGSIKLISTDISSVPDIQDTDGDGSPIRKRFVVTSIYQYDVQIPGSSQIPDLVNVKDLTIESVVYNGKEQGPKVSYNGTVLEENKDYTWNKTDETRAYKDAGTYGIELIGKGGRFTGRTETGYSILPKKAAPAVALSKTSYVYNGNVKKPGVTVKVGRTTLPAGQYTVTYAKGRKNVGKYKVTVILKGNYSGSKTVSFTIKPKTTSIKSLKAGSKNVTVVWNKQTAQTTGYQVQVSLKKDFSVIAAGRTVTNNKTNSAVIKGLKTGKAYYVRIRTYKTVGKAKYYSAWKTYTQRVKIK